jgi:hypothetical protein
MQPIALPASIRGLATSRQLPGGAAFYRIIARLFHLYLLNLYKITFLGEFAKWMELPHPRVAVVVKSMVIIL